MKDIDRNITSQLYKLINTVKGLNIVNGVLQPSSGGTGSRSLSDAYPSMVKDSNFAKIGKADIHLRNGFTMADDFSLLITVNQKSLYFDGLMHITASSSADYTNGFLNITLPIGGFDIKNIQISPNPYSVRMSIQNKTLTLYGFFPSNEINYTFNSFIPII